MASTNVSTVAALQWAQQAQDFDQMTARIRGWETHFTQCAPGRGCGTVFETVLPSARLVRLVVDTAVALEALPLSPEPDELFHVGTISDGANGLRWQGRPVLPDLLMLKQGAFRSRFVLPSGCEFLVARLDRERIDSVSRALCGGEIEPVLRRSQLHPQSSSTLAKLHAHIRFLVRNDLAARGESLDLVERDLYERVAPMLTAPPLPVDPPPDTRRRVLRRAEEYVRAHARERFSLSDLCIASECSERTLRTVFRECYGTSPMAFVKKIRLCGLRQDLRDAVPHTTTILHLALHWGFWHMGHLGRDYTLLFGETPSETLLGSRALSQPTQI